MTKTIVINPVTRISGFMEIQAYTEGNRVVDVKTEGLLFRGFEKMLIGRNPFDAVYFTQRICGICSSAHSIASTLALEAAMGIIPSEQGRYLRDIIHGCEYLQNHIRHFYQYTLPDYVKLPEEYSLLKAEHKDFRLPKQENDRLIKDYFASLDISRSAHEMLSVLGGKAPHNHGVFIGGITAQPTTDKIIKIKALLNTITKFIDEIMLSDVYTISKYYNDYFQMGKSYNNFLSYGCFDNYKELGTLYLDPQVYENGERNPFNSENISEEIDYSWYKADDNSCKFLEKDCEPNMAKPQAYSWVKTSRYNNKPFETGPLARQWLSGEYRNGNSAMDRTIARVLEAKKITKIMNLLISNLIPDVKLQQKYTVPNNAIGKGLIDTTRGALGHWLGIENQTISAYQIITPSVWNLSPRGVDNLRGTGEEALYGTIVENLDNPIELGRIIRSFDPCVSCATHAYVNTTKVD